MRAAVVFLTTVAFVLAMALAARPARDGRRDWRAPERLPDVVTTAARPAAWILVRSGCAHCARHLDALERAAALLAPADRAASLRCLHIVGWKAKAPAGAVAEPDSLLRAFDIHSFPTTCFVGASGDIETIWRGARGVSAWCRVLGRLAASEAR